MPGPLHVILLVDALGWEVVGHHGFLEEVPARSPLGTVLGYSSAAIPSLLSGSPPSVHGNWAMYRRAGADGPFRFLRRMPRVPHAIEWRARRAIRRWIDRRGLIAGYYDLYEIPVHLLSRFDVAQHSDPYAPGGLSVETLFDWMCERGVEYRLWTYRTPESQNLDEAVAAVADPKAEVLFVYTAELDALMHRVDIRDDAVSGKLRVYEEFARRVFAASERAGRSVELHVFSDHGMAPVTDCVDVWAGIEKRGYRLGRDYDAFFDSTMVRIWGRKSVADAAQDAFEGMGRLFEDGELEKFGCLFAGREYGEHILVADPGVMVVPSFMGRAQIAGMHGYDPEDPYSAGVFLTTCGGEAPPKSILGVKDWLVRAIDEAAA